GLAIALAVTQFDSIQAFVAAVRRVEGRIDVLVNNAGLAAGLEPVAEGDDANWVQMLETNVLGMLRMTQACLPLLRKATLAHIVNLVQSPASRSILGEPGTRPASMLSEPSAGPFGWNSWVSQFGSPKLTLGWWRPNSAWSV